MRTTNKVQYDPTSSTEWRPSYKLLTGAILPRAIAFVSTVDSAGRMNLAPFSFFTAACANPPTVLFCPMRKGDEAVKKDTLAFLQETGDFVVNVVTEAIVEPMNVCATDFPAGDSEFERSGLTPVASVKVKSPRVGESPVSLECKLKEVVEVSSLPGGGAIVIGEVVMFHVADNLFEDFRIDTQELKPVGRLAGSHYCRVNDLFELTRQTFKEYQASGAP